MDHAFAQDNQQRALTYSEPAATPSSAFAAVAAHNQKVSATPQRDGRKPNILVIMGDDIGWFNPSCYNHGIMGYKTPNIDRIAKEGVMFTDAYYAPSLSGMERMERHQTFQESSKCTTMPMKNALSPIQSRPRYFAIRSS
jgi:hypothetical protein